MIGVPSANAKPAAPTTDRLARSVKRENIRTDGTKRFCAACLDTPMLEPISLQEAPERRAWSTKCPINASAWSDNRPASSMASER
ncbi:Uncharacterised protein [Mycobacteroides abscessus subsp. abscessus]|nr:Uncharacterised protein [Mycobacteroides abscessus]SHV89538.1 Uncharacterised protein [Mycobacteroides abscessus subsp. abscessus]SHW37422.1 Uncharacterised protein [Mycobacteroides abscessus subsp. abscessus]SKW43798.1 Uncharacterised protein [Mycobacteroides abscessus subsp. abscessus]